VSEFIDYKGFRVVTEEPKDRGFPKYGLGKYMMYRLPGNLWCVYRLHSDKQPEFINDTSIIKRLIDKFCEIISNPAEI